MVSADDTRGLNDKEGHPQNSRKKRELESVRVHACKAREKSFHFEFKGELHNKQVTFLVDTGCSAMVIGRETLNRLHLPFKASKVKPVRFEYGNLQTEEITESISLVIEIGKYQRRWEFYVADIGDTAILGNPFHDSIHVIDQLAKEGRFGFLDLWNQEAHLWKMDGHHDPTETPRTCYAVKMIAPQEFHEHFLARGKRVGMVTVKLLSERGEATDPTKIAVVDPLIVPLLEAYQARFKEPTELPPTRPGLDMEINLVPDSKIPKWRSI